MSTEESLIMSKRGRMMNIGKETKTIEFKK